uniref:Cytochrome c oxidase subunit 3 n=1 Tax=Pseudoneureclipsis sibuyana TaxID=2904893 RepID=A0A9E8LP77_9NEOP|nr:cytochrome c oxidase subunit III [Pseudoneureclipsis sibuyana]UZZ44291.1 cytochrome c oxidase subunit III [Pseudoneureclipsis sibuyana]
MKNTFNHPFHLVNYSPWPIMSALSLMTSMSGMINWFHEKSPTLLMIGLSMTVMTSIQWWRDMTRESTFQGMHTKMVTLNMKYGMILFIISEVLFFSSFFWAFFHNSLSPDTLMGNNWPPKNIEPFNPFKIPLLNTLILLSSGITVTWTHNSMINNKLNKALISLTITIILGIYFTMIQMIEYMNSPFSISDSIYGSTFFMTTGFHGLHVIIGTIFLFTSMMRMKMNHLSQSHHFGFEAAAWYWHFVDIVWLFLFSFMYWWAT